MLSRRKAWEKSTDFMKVLRQGISRKALSGKAASAIQTVAKAGGGILRPLVTPPWLAVLATERPFDSSVIKYFLGFIFFLFFSPESVCY